MELKEKLKADLATAMRGGDSKRRDTLRMLLAAVKQEEIDLRVNLDNDGVLAILSKQAKQRRESIADAQKAGRPQMAEDERAELTIIEKYLPQLMTAEEIQEVAREVIANLGANGVQDMGRVMSQLMPQLKGRADGRMVSEAVRMLLQG